MKVKVMSKGDERRELPRVTQSYPKVMRDESYPGGC